MCGVCSASMSKTIVIDPTRFAVSFRILISVGLININRSHDSWTVKLCALSQLLQCAFLPFINPAHSHGRHVCVPGLFLLFFSLSFIASPVPISFFFFFFILSSTSFLRAVARISESMHVFHCPAGGTICDRRKLNDARGAMAPAKMRHRDERTAAATEQNAKQQQQEQHKIEER